MDVHTLTRKTVTIETAKLAHITTSLYGKELKWDEETSGATDYLLRQLYVH